MLHAHSPEAIVAFRKTTSLDPFHRDALINIGIAFLFLEDYSKAAEAFRETVRISSDDMEALYRLGITALQLKNFEEALESFSLLVKLTPENMDAHFYHGIALIFSGKKNEAERKCRFIQSHDTKLAKQLREMLSNEQ